MINSIISEIISQKPPLARKILEKVFQTQKGGYGFGDKICGTRVPILRNIAAKYKDISLELCEKLLQNELHEARFVALVILIKQFKKSPKEVFDIYCRNLKYVNNWDLVDISAYWIVGDYCILVSDTRPIFDFADSDNLWANRVSIVATFSFIKINNFSLTLELCECFCSHDHHLIHKACGWMLREVSKKDPICILEFIEENKNRIPTLMRSYALEWIKKHNRHNGYAY